MNLPETDGCPRCQDYDKVKDELDSSKRRAQDDQKSALKKCEDSRTHLQKKLLTVGAAAVVGGTILGKDFVDKIAEYIESFNQVKDGASKLIGQADPPPLPDLAQNEDATDKEEKEEDTEEKEYTYRPGTFAGGSSGP